MNKVKPAFQMYAAEFYADTAMLSQAEVGALVRIMCQHWRGMDVSTREAREGASLGPITDRLDTFITRELDKLDQLKAEYAALSATRSEAGAKGGKSKAFAKQKQSKTQAKGVGVGVGVEDGVGGEGEGRSRSRERARAPEPDLIAPDAYADAWNEWLAHRREIRKPMTIRSQRMQLNEFVGWTPERITTAIRHSIANGYQGIFEPKQQHHGQSTGQVRPEHLSAQDRLRMALEANALHHASIRDAGGGDGA